MLLLTPIDWAYFGQFLSDIFFWHFLIMAFVVGGIPSGLWIGLLFYHVDIRKHGSHNIGATNVVRVLGKIPGIITFMIDSGKGILVALFGWWAFGQSVAVGFLGAILAVLGHTRSIFLQFRGGKGVASFFGVLLILDYRIFSAAILGWLLAFLITRTSGISAIATLLILPITIFQLHNLTAVFWILSITCCYIILLHHRNIANFLKKT